MISIELKRRYENDSKFHQLTDTIVKNCLIERVFTLKDLRSAIDVAEELYEKYRVEQKEEESECENPKTG